MAAPVIPDVPGSLPPGPRSFIPGVNLLAFRRDPLGFLGEVARRYGDIAYFQLGSQHVYLLSHPEYIKDVLVTHDRKFKKGRILERAKRVLGEGLLTSEGEFHLRQRRLMQPSFQHRRIAHYADAMVEASAAWGGRWQHGETRDMHSEMLGLGLVVAGQTLFGSGMEHAAEAISEAMNAFMDVFGLIMLPFSELLEKLPLPAVRRVDRARQRLDEIMYRLIAERRRLLSSQPDSGAQQEDDLLSMLVRAQDTEGGTGAMTDEQVRDECVTIILAGHETTAAALTWTWYLLSQHPAVEARLHRELDSVLSGRRATADDIPSLRYTEMVFRESMRLYPPAWGLARKTLEPHEIAGYEIPRGGIVLANPYLVQRDPRWFANPERFDPERWEREDGEEARPKFAYFPFGGGPRRCIGEGFAWMEGVLLLATLAQRWQMRLAEGQRIGMKPVLTLRPRYGMRMVLASRSSHL